MATCKDSFMGVALTYLDTRKMTNADGSANQDEWLSQSGSIGRIVAGGTGAECFYNPVQGSAPVMLIAHTVRVATADLPVKASISTLGANFLQVATNVDVATGRGYVFEVGNVGFGPNTARFTDGTNLINAASGTRFSGAGSGDGVDLSALTGQPLSLQIIPSIVGGKQRLVGQYMSGAGTWVTVLDCIVADSDFQSVPTTGGSAGVWFGNFGSAGNLTDFTAGPYTPLATAPIPGVSSDMLYLGDSNGQFQTPVAAGLGRRSEPRAVGEVVKAAGYATVRVHNVSQSGTTTGQWATGAGAQNLYLLDHAVKLASYKGTKIVLIGLGTNDAKDDTATTAAQYKTNIQSLINAFLAVGVTNFILLDPAYVVPTTANFTGANARIQSYASKNTELVSYTITQISGLYAYFQTNNGATYLPDGIHYSLGTAGAPAARDIIAAGVKPVVLALTPLPAAITGNQAIFKYHYSLVPNDTLVYPQPVIVRAGRDGFITMDDANGNKVRYSNVRAGDRLPVPTTRIWANGTDAPDLVGMNG